MASIRDLLTDVNVEVACPTCNASLRAHVGQFRRRETLQCPAGHRVQLSEDSRAFDQADDVFERFQTQLRRIGR